MEDYFALFVHAVLFGFEALLFRCPALHLFFYFGKTRVKEKDFSVSFFWLTCAAWSSARRLARIASSSSSPDILFRFVSSLIFFSFSFSQSVFHETLWSGSTFRDCLSLSLSLSLCCRLSRSLLLSFKPQPKKSSQEVVAVADVAAAAADVAGPDGLPPAGAFADCNSSAVQRNRCQVNFFFFFFFKKGKKSLSPPRSPEVVTQT